MEKNDVCLLGLVVLLFCIACLSVVKIIQENNDKDHFTESDETHYNNE